MIRETVSREFSVIVNAKQNSIKKPEHPTGNFKRMTAPITCSVGRFCYLSPWLKFSPSVFAF
jgi:hypothetical protein